MKKRHRNQNPFPSDESIMEAVRLHEEGWTLKETGRKMGRATSGIHLWIHEYAPLIVNKDMKTNDDDTNGGGRAAVPASCKGKREVGAKAPETPQVHPSGEESLEQKVARLERELKDARPCARPRRRHSQSSMPSFILKGKGTLLAARS